MRIKVDVEEVELPGDHGRQVPGVCVRCPECGHEETSFGRTGRSVRRCLALLRENCPDEGENFYVADAADD